MPHNDIRRIVLNSPFRPIKILAPIIAVMLCFCAICVYILIQERRTVWEHAGDAAASLTAAIKTDLIGNIETLDLSLRAVVDNLKHPELGQVSPGLRQLVLFDRSATARHAGAILVLDEFGKVRLDSRTLKPEALDLSDRDYFTVHRDHKSDDLYIGRPQIARKTGYYFVGVSRRLSHPDGSFAGVAVATLRLSYFKQLFQDISLGPNANITLSHIDGAVLMRWPYNESYIGLDLSRAELYKKFALSPSGRFETTAMTDGVHRLVVYSQIGDLPIIIGIGQSTSDIYAQWRVHVCIVALLMAALCFMAAFLSRFLLRELRRHAMTEKKLATLAATDGLTGLSNRWHFDETIRREWRRAHREAAPLALLMIDTDLFKSYNDHHGHQAGDLLLKTIGSAISGSIRRGTDLGARYGGDEFAVLLPGTSLDGARRVAHQICDELRIRCLEENIDDAQVSIGVACLVALRSVQHTALLAMADGALYRAKSGGRNRIEVAESEVLRSQQTARPESRQAA